MKFKNSQGTVDAVQFEGGMPSIQRIVEGLQPPENSYNFENGGHGKFYLHKEDGTHTADVGDWIVKDANGEFEVVKEEIFKQTYEAVGSHLSTIIYRIRRYEEKYGGDIERMKKEPLFLSAVKDTQEYQAHWDDQTEEEVKLANELWKKYSKHLPPQNRKNAKALKEQWEKEINELSASG